MQERHSCVRKVVAFKRLAKKQNWRLLSRALEEILRVSLFSFECWSLKDASKRLYEGIQVLVASTDNC